MTFIFLILSGILPGGCQPISNLLPKAEIQSEELREVSGVIPAQAGGYWGVNDSGHPPVLYRFDEAGTVLQRVPLDYAANTDWEAMTRDSAGHLYVADIGDNSKRRQIYTIYRLIDGQDGPKPDGVIRFRYDDGKSYNGESVFVFEGEFFLLSKEDRGERAVLFSFPLPEVADGIEQRAVRVGVLQLAGPVTDAAYSATRKELAVLTYLGPVLFRLERPEDLLGPPKDSIPGIFGQCEALSYTPDGSLLVTNEPGSLWVLPLPTASASTKSADKPSDASDK